MRADKLIRNIAAVLVAICVPMFCIPVFAQDGPVVTVDIAVERFAAAVAAYRKDADRAKVDAVVTSFVEDYADIAGASRVILGDYLEQASADQRERIAQALQQRVVRVLADFIVDLQFPDIVLEPFEDSLDWQPVTVKARVPMQDGYILDLHMRLHDRRGSWRIIDVVTEGVSYLRTYRSEFAQAVLRYGLDEAIERFARA